jgi:hypothetical protein
MFAHYCNIKVIFKEDNFSTWESFLYFVLCPEYLSLYVKQETVDQLFFVLNIHDYSTNVHFYFFRNVMFLKIFKVLIFVVFYSTKCLSSDKVYQLYAHGRWFSPGTPVSSTTKTGRHVIAEILLKMVHVLNTK